MTDIRTADNLPPVLYHYTEAGGLQGILGPGRGPYMVNFHDDDSKFRYQGDHNLYTNGKAALFRATDVRYMNDSQELVFGAAIVNERLRKAAEEGELEEALRKTFLSVARVFDPDKVFEWPFRCFAVCFCEDGDLLSQWRGYAGGVGGFSIGFSRHVLAECSFGIHVMAAGNIRDLPSPAQLVKVAYGKRDALARAEELVDVIKDNYRHGNLIIDLDGTPGLAVAIAVFRAIAGMKHKAFREEREWRLLAVSDVNQQVRTRSRSSGVVPYMDLVVNGRLRVDTRDVFEKPLTEVFVGPAESSQSVGQIVAVRDLLKSRGMWGFGDVPVVPSDAPFRS